MDGVKLGFNLVDFAKANKMGIGSFRLKDGSSLKIITNPQNGVSHFMNVKYGRLLSAESAKGNENIAKILDLYDDLAENPIEIFEAYAHSLDLVI